MVGESAAVTFLFTDIEGSTRLWEESPARMRVALARHDALARTAVEEHRRRRGEDHRRRRPRGLRAPPDALAAVLQMQLALADPEATAGMATARALRPARGNARAPRCGFLRPRGQPRGADHGRRPRRPGAAVAGRGGARARPPAGRRHAARPGCRAPARPQSPERVWQLATRACAGEFPPLRSLAATPNNLPAAAEHLHRPRARDWPSEAAAGGEPAGDAAGVGGTGKTPPVAAGRGRRRSTPIPDGVWFVDLAALTDPRLVAQALASVLGVKEEAGAPVRRRVCSNTSRTARMLLILDNCEHVAARLRRARRGAAAMRARRCASWPPAASRCGVAGETIYPVPALTVARAGCRRWRWRR